LTSLPQPVVALHFLVASRWCHSRRSMLGRQSCRTASRYSRRRVTASPHPTERSASAVSLARAKKLYLLLPPRGGAYCAVLNMMRKCPCCSLHLGYCQNRKKNCASRSGVRSGAGKPQRVEFIAQCFPSSIEQDSDQEVGFWVPELVGKQKSEWFEL
jgi:hypothetical protein